MRIAAIGSNIAFIAYALSLALTRLWSRDGRLLPLDVYRLLKWRQLARQPGERRPPLMAAKDFARGDVLFRKGDPADQNSTS